MLGGRERWDKWEIQKIKMNMEQRKGKRKKGTQRDRKEDGNDIERQEKN